MKVACALGVTLVLSLAAQVLTGCSSNAESQSSKAARAAEVARPWPPELYKNYPELELQSLSGKKVKLTSFKGKAILIEPIGLSCSACQAFAGGEKKGGFQGVVPQQGLPSIDSLLTKQGVSPQDSRLVRVQLLLYSPSMIAPTSSEAQAWAKHFDFGNRPNEVVLIGDSSYINDGSYNMIPGFQLVDKDFVMRSDACGHSPKNDLYRELLPKVKEVLKEVH